MTPIKTGNHNIIPFISYFHFRSEFFPKRLYSLKIIQKIKRGFAPTNQLPYYPPGTPPPTLLMENPAILYITADYKKNTYACINRLHDFPSTCFHQIQR